MIQILQGLERWMAKVLGRIAHLLNHVAGALDSAPLSEACRSVFPGNNSLTLSLSTESSIILFTITISIICAFSIPFLYRLFYDDLPRLSPVPRPSEVYDPDVDTESESFGDDDVRPQLVDRDVTPSIHALSPCTGRSLGYVSSHTVNDVALLVGKARTAQKAWASSSFTRRRRVLRSLSDYILYEQKGLSEVSSLDSGKTLLEAVLGEIIPTLEKLRWLITEGEAALRPSRRTVGPMTLHKLAQVEYDPVGVIAAIAPWNYSFHNIMNPVSAALFSGCAIVVKPSEHTVWSAVHYTRVIRRVLTICGEDADLVQCLVGGPEVAEALVRADIDKIFFTGSTTVGRKVAVAAAERLTPTCLELGGKDACIICDDADIKHAVTICLRGVFQNAGQNCIAFERLYVHKLVKDQFIELILSAVKQIRLGVDMGGMTLGPTAIKHVQTLVDDAIDCGAQLLSGGKQADVDGGGWYYEPTVLSGVTKDMKIAREELFGPVICIYEWDDDDKVIESINSCPFGLGSSVFTRNQARGDKLLKQLKVGMCNINDFAANYLCQSLPFGGTKDSGSDRFAGIEGLRGCCVMKATTRDRFNSIRTTIPKALRYPVGVNASEFAFEINDLMYSKGIISKLDNLRQLVGMALFPSWKPRTVGSG